MNHEQWSSLTASPGWKPFQKLLRDFRESIKEQWAVGKVPNIDDARARCEILADLSDLDWDSIDRFYNPDKEPTSDSSSD